MKQKHKMQYTKAALVLMAGLLLAACDSGGQADDPLPDATPVLEQVAQEVITATYANMNTTAQALVQAVDALQTNPTLPNLEAARAAWRAVRTPWEQSEGFLFGPVDIEGIDPAVDSWPVNEVDLDAVLASSDVLTVEYIDGLEGTLKGFHTIEYLLFGPTGTKQPQEFTARQFVYLSSTARSLQQESQQLVDAWSGTSGYAMRLATAGDPGNSLYISERAALQELVGGMVTIADEVGNGKINDPFTQQDVTLEESRFSANSKADFQDNIRSILHIYTGDYGTSTGAGLDELVRAQDAALDTRVRQQIDAAIAAIGNIPGTFTAAIFTQRAAVQAAQEAVRTLQQTLEAEVAPLLSNP
jgi:uncharacterized iron-regulated protein